MYVLDYTAGESDSPESLSADDHAGLVRGLQSSNQFWRLTAQRLIVENELRALVPELVTLIGAERLDARGFDGAAVHALWTLHGLGALESVRADVEGALSHPSAAVRKAAIEVLPPDAATGEVLAAANVFTDPSLNTRLAAVLRVLDLGAEASAEVRAATEAAREGADQWVLAALGALHPPAVEAAQAAPALEETEGLPPAQLTLNAPGGIMRFEQERLRAFEDQGMTLVFTNNHPDLHNAVFLQKNALWTHSAKRWMGI